MAFLVPSFDSVLVVASILIAMLSAYVMLDFAKRAPAAGRRSAHAMLVGGSVAMGTGIWSMHFVGMLAYSLPISLGYTRHMTSLSWLAGVAACFVALRVAAGAPSAVRIAGGALVMGLGICAMHYTGMAALDMAPGIVWDWVLVVASVGIAIAASAAALLLFFWLRKVRAEHSMACQIGSAIVMGLATSGMHYTGMAAARFPEGTVCLSAGALGGGGLGALALVASTMMLAMTLFVSTLDARMQRRAAHFAMSLKGANSRLRSANQALRLQAQIDALTGLPNRQRFEDQMDRSMTRLGRGMAAGDDGGRGRLAVLFIDLDRLRPVNDSFGHAAGDMVLKEVALRLGKAARHGDTVARVGGDEFLLLAQDWADRADCVALAERLIEHLERPFEVLGRQVTISASVGIAVYPDHGQRNEVVARADAAMRAAKRLGGGTCAIFDPGMESAALEELTLLGDLRHAIEREQLTLHYQPKVDGQRGQIRGVEALLRWQHPRRGFVSPSQFIPIAERSGLIVALGNWVIDEACRQMQAWADAGVRMRVAINVSAHQLRRADLAIRVEQALARHQVEPSQLLCEITESVAMDDIKSAQRAIEGLERIGVYLSIDDFGTGYSSLSYLRQLPVKQLKIDRSFVSDLGANSDARAIVDAVIRLAHALGLSVVAEGVETAGQRDTLMELGCDELQGYLFAKPMPPDALLAWARGTKPAGAVDFSPSVMDELMSA